MEVCYCTWVPFAGRREEAAFQKEISRKLIKVALLRVGRNPEGMEEFRTAEGRPGYHGLDFDFNLSHTTGMAACAVGVRVGVDCEAPRPYSPAVAQRVCTEMELAVLGCKQDPAQEFLRLWTMKEAFVKLDGRGFAYGLKNVTEKNIYRMYPEIKIFQTLINGAVLTAMDKAGGEIHLQKVDLLS